jgi:hypothetical protein
VTSELAARFAVWLIERHGLAASTAERRSQEIMSIVNDWQAKCDGASHSRRRKPLSDNPNTSRWTLRTYLDDAYIPAKKRGGNSSLTDRTIGFYRQAIDQLDRFVGKPVLCCEVTEELMDRFVVSMVKRGLTYKTARSRVHNIKGIVRHWNPDRFPLALEHVGKPWFPDADDKRTLDYVFFKKYLPE